MAIRSRCVESRLSSMASDRPGWSRRGTGLAIGLRHWLETDDVDGQGQRRAQDIAAITPGIAELGIGREPEHGLRPLGLAEGSIGPELGQLIADDHEKPFDPIKPRLGRMDRQTLPIRK